MLSLRILFSLMLVTLCCVEFSDAWWSWSRGGHTITVRPMWIGARLSWTWRFSGHQPTEQRCDAVADAMTTREDWGASKARAVINMPGTAEKVYLYHTGADPCKWVKLDEGSCDECLHNPDCVKEVVRGIQYEDLRTWGKQAGKDDIRYTYLVGQDGLVYEGRGFGITGQYTDDGQDHKSIGVAMIGDFSDNEPNQASQDALMALLSCGEAGGYISEDYLITADKGMTGQAFYNMLDRCNGLCVATKR